MQTYLATSMTMWISFKATNLDTSQGKTDFGVAIGISVIVVLAFPAFSYCWLKRNHKRLGEPDFKVKYDSLYQNLNYEDEKALPHTLYFLVRRLLFTVVVVYLT